MPAGSVGLRSARGGSEMESVRLGLGGASVMIVLGRRAGRAYPACGPKRAGDGVMEIVKELLAQVAGDDARVEALCIGAFWTAVSSRRTGLAATCLETDSRHTAHPAP
ncbi:MAG: DUF4213 domain-containing protein, partial [Candidatus Marinimicrobia bacterium]|nr:DUF4213 domain-containing protein [Candidatus Neomarinimicrobiota bacterium]